MAGHGDSLALAYAASDAYENANVNIAFVDRTLEGLRADVQIDDESYAELLENFHEVLLSNRTAPSVMRIMALANEARLAGIAAEDESHGWLARRSLRKQAASAREQLVEQAAATLDALLRERY
jgi:hypothetical protein